jgi:hypothetical protein
MTVASRPAALDATGYSLEVGDRVGSFRRDVPGTVAEIGRHLLHVLHDGDAEATTYLIADLSGAAPGVFKLNLTGTERRL